MSFVLRPYQQEAVDKAVHFLRTSKGQNGLMQLPTGSGKSLVIAGICKELGAPTLVFQPNKEILAQNASKLRMYGYPCGIYSASAGQKTMRDITFCTVGSVVKKLHLLERFRYVLVDECFLAGTLIDGRPIETIQPGEMVNSLNHNTGMVEKRRVVRLFRNKAKGRMVVVTLSDGSSITCTENHPFFVVGKGYISACDLTTSSVLLKHGKTKTTEELRELRKGLSSKHKGKKGCVLFKGVREGVQGEEQAVTFRDLPRLLKADDNTREPKDELHRYAKGVLQSGVLKEVQAQRQANHNERISGAVFQANEGAEPYVDARRQGENDGELQGQYVPIARGQRGAHQAPADAASCDRITDGARYRNGSGEGGTSITSAPLQSGPCSPRGETCDRGGWQDAQAEEVAILGPQENHGLEFVGVASVEVYQRTGGGRDAEVCQDDTVYNFEVEHNNNYFANGVLVHNCHLVNSAEGMYEEVLSHMGVPVVGMTATPYRLGRVTDERGDTRSILKFLTRTRPRIFDRLIYHVQNRELFDAGYLAQLRYFEVKAVNTGLLRANSTGADYTDQSVREAYRQSGFHLKLVQVVNRLFEIGRRNAIVFTRFTEEARWLAQQVQGCAIVTAETPAKERDRVINAFQTSRIRCVANVGILTTGFDYPELEAVVTARPTMSLALWYQMVGRGVRPHPDKDHCMVVDMCGNLPMFGKVEDLHLSSEGGWHIRTGERQLTNVPFGRAYTIHQRA